MPLPKSITSLLTAIVVAVPAAITTLALNKPKPPKEIDEVIQLDENQEEIPEDEITPTKSAPLSVPSPSFPISSSGGSGGIGDVSSDSQSSESSESSESSDDQLESQGSEEPEEKTTMESEAVPEEPKEEKEEENENEDDPEEPPTEDGGKDQSSDQEESKDPSIQELEDSIVSIIEILINEGKDFDIKNSRLYKQYTISSKLVELKKTIESWKTKKEEETKATQEKGSSASTEQKGK